MDKLKSIWKSRRVWVAIAGVAVACANSLGVEVDAETVQYVVILSASLYSSFTTGILSIKSKRLSFN